MRTAAASALGAAYAAVKASMGLALGLVLVLVYAMRCLTGSLCSSSLSLTCTCSQLQPCTACMRQQASAGADRQMNSWKRQDSWTHTHTHTHTHAATSAVQQADWLYISLQQGLTTSMISVDVKRVAS